ncbi:MAG: hypothetical protein H5T96_09275 [Tissierellales bacterium]|nr:hypothetical protein [Tissierellales bacterium]
MYFKNVYEDNTGKLKSVPFFGYGQEAIDKFKSMYYEGKLWSKDKYNRIEKAIDDYKGQIGKKSEIGHIDSAVSRFLASLLGEEYDSMFVEDYVRSHSKEEVVDRIVEKLYKQSLENEYMRSMEQLISNPLNFERLVKPNSAKQLEDLSKKVAGEGAFNYENVGNMLDIEFMSKLRHAFVSGKYAIGIAATNQTIHSLFQRVSGYIDRDRIEIIKKTNPEEADWLGDGKIKFEKFNTMRVGNKVVPTLSMIRNAERSSEFPKGQDISDINTQFVDGYVDISKGPWIMELGATPNVTSTWLFLVKLGVPVDTVAYFMNQPIIKDYLRTIDNSGYSWLFIQDFVDDVKSLYEPKVKTSTPTMIPSKGALEKTMELSADKMSPIQLEQQKFMLDEFLKYAKMANHLFYVTQGTNFDTANFNDPYLVFKKMEQLKRAQNSIIGGVDGILKNSFVGYLGATINDVRDSLATILKSDQPKVRGIIEQTLLPYINTSDRDFVKIARKAVSDLFDYALQTNEGLNIYLNDALVEDGGTAREVQKFVNSIGKNHPLYNNEVVRAIKIIPSRDVDGVNNVRIKGSSNKVYDQNNMIYAFRELRDYLGTDSKLYDNLVMLAVLQSGLSGSAVSFTSLIPFEDFERIYNKTINKLESLPNLRNFNTLNVFQRVNWGNNEIVPYVKARWTKNKKYNPSMQFLPKQVKQAVEDNNIPPVMTQNVLSRVGEQDHIVYSWEKMDELITPEWQAKYPSLKGYQLIKKIKSDMRNQGDFSYINRGLFEKVRDVSGKEFTTQDKQGNSYYIYKAINAWGDSWRAKEFYDVEHKSVLNNRMIKVEGVDNNTIIDTFNKKTTNQKTQSKENIAEVATQGSLFPQEQINSSSIKFEEHPTFGYRERTIRNASADITIAIAADFTSAGERLTKSAVLNQKKIYLPFSTDIFASRNEIEISAARIAREINKKANQNNGRVSLNIAGNGIYTLNRVYKGYTQNSIDKFTLELFQAVKDRLNSNVNLSVRTGGQTGFDESGAKAAISLGFPTTILAPKGWTFRNIKGQDISSEQSFKARFTQQSVTQTKGGPIGIPQIQRPSKKC